MQELKPCPFCGGAVENYDLDIIEGIPVEMEVRCSCGVTIKCKAELFYANSLNNGESIYTPYGTAFDIWNRRADNGGEGVSE